MGKKLHLILSKDTENKTGFCKHCGPVKIKFKAGHWKCQIAVNQHRGQRPPGPSWTHGLTIEEAAALRAGKSCEICGSTTSLCVDHCHQTDAIRGILCKRCNFGLGYFKDSAINLSAAIKYLSQYKKPAEKEISGRV